MANPIFLPLQQKIPLKSTLQGASDLVIFFLLLSLLFYRLISFGTQGAVWRLAFLCELWFTFIWVLIVSTRWSRVEYKTYPHRFLDRAEELPAVDMFVTTADSSLEPPIITVNTVLSLLAVDYPAHKLACYVSDDGCSAFTFYSLVEASKFAKSWVPFCKKYDVQVRAPFMYFSQKHENRFGDSSSGDFECEWRKMKKDYEELKRKIEDAAQNSFSIDEAYNDELVALSKMERGNHPSVVKVIWENKGKHEDGVPHLIYVAREKRPKYSHHFKAGAMNVLTRVSGVMTNAPFMLNVDCDMFVNNPQAILHAMCLLFGFQSEKESAFVQFPQRFYGELKDDPFGTSFIVLIKLVMNGMAGIQGPLYGGTGCFHRRKVIYGLSPMDDKGEKLNSEKGEAIQRRFGCSKELSRAVARIISGKPDETHTPCNLLDALEVAKEVAGSCYEFNTCWGQEVGWMYGSTTEDILTGMRIHSLGWESAYCDTEPASFLGCTPTGGPACMKQQMRWGTGLLQVLLGKHTPLLSTLTKKLRFRQCLAYMIIYLWPLRSLPESCYLLLPAFCLLTNTSFLPKPSEPAMLVPIAIFIFYNLYTMLEYLSCGLSIRAWWNYHRMRRIISVSAWTFSLLEYFLDLLGLSKALFIVTPKEQNAAEKNMDADVGSLTFDSSPYFIPGTTLVFVHITALALFLLGVQVQPVVERMYVSGIGEIVCSMWVVLSFLPFVKGLFRKGSYGIPWPTILKALILAFLFVFMCASVWFF